MPRAGQWRSAWPWRCRQQRAKRSSRLAGRPPARVRHPPGPPAHRIGEEAGDGALVRGSIAGGADTAATASGGKQPRLERSALAEQPVSRRRIAVHDVVHDVGLLQDAALDLPALRGEPARCIALTGVPALRTSPLLAGEHADEAVRDADTTLKK